MKLDIAALKAKAAATIAAMEKEKQQNEPQNQEVKEAESTTICNSNVGLRSVVEEASKSVLQERETAPLTAAEQIVGKIADLQEALQKQLPGYESVLHFIHFQLHKNEDVVHLLTEEQIGIIVAGLAKKKNIVLTTSAAKGGNKTPSGKKIKDLSLEDLM